MSGTVAALDLGATSGRVVVGHIGRNTLEMHEFGRFPNEPVIAGDRLHWNVLGLYSEALRGLRNAFQSHPDTLSVGIDSWAVDYALLHEGRMLGNPFHYRDERTERGVAITHAVVPHSELFARNGLQFLPFTTLYQLAAEHPAILGVADSLLLIPDLFAHLLTGNSRVEVTNASTTGLLRVYEREWDDELVNRLGLRRSILPPLISPGERIGMLRPSVAASLAAPEGVAVTAVASHDTASAVVAVPMEPESSVYISCGTWALVGVELERPVLSRDALEANFSNEGGVDGRVRLLRNVMGLWILNELLRQWECEGDSLDLSTLLGAAQDVDPRRVPVFDVDDPLFLPPGNMTSRIDAWCSAHDVTAPRTPAEYVRATIESLAHAFARAAQDAARIGGVAVGTIHLVGGGSLNALLCQRTADHAGLSVLAGPVEATALGNILVQARSLGLVGGSLEALRDLVARTHPPRRYEPRATAASGRGRPLSAP